MSLPTRLGDDHLDLIMTAALRWRVLPTRHTAGTDLERRLIVSMATQVGRQVQAENMVSMAALAHLGQTRLAGRRPTAQAEYEFRPVDQLLPVEVIKAVHAAREACRHSPTWKGSSAHRWLDAVLIAATYRLDGYATAPWHWTRPQRRTGVPVAVASRAERRIPIPGLTWITPDELVDHWDQASLVIIGVDAVLTVASHLPARVGVFVLVDETDHDPHQVWVALTSLHMEALALYWPSCRPWLSEQLADPSMEYAGYRSDS